MRASKKKSTGRFIDGYYYYQTEGVSPSGTIYLMCRHRLSLKKCPSRGKIIDGSFIMTSRHNHPINDTENLLRIFNDELHDAVERFTDENLDIIYNEIYSEYEDFAKAILDVRAPFKTMELRMKRWRGNRYSNKTAKSMENNTSATAGPSGQVKKKEHEVIYNKVKECKRTLNGRIKKKKRHQNNRKRILIKIRPKAHREGDRVQILETDQKNEGSHQVQKSKKIKIISEKKNLSGVKKKPKEIIEL